MADLFGEVLSSEARLRIMDAVSLRPRTLGELSDLAGISVQGVLRHVKRLVELGLVEEKGLSKAAPKARLAYGARSIRVRDYSTSGFALVKSTEALPSPKAKGKIKDLEGASADLLILRRRIREEARKLGRLIDEAADGQELLATEIRSLPLSVAERLILEVVLTEDTLQDGVRALSRYYGLEDRRSIESALSKAKRLVGS
jgi:predicted transcriptional regulator